MIRWIALWFGVLAFAVAPGLAHDQPATGPNGGPVADFAGNHMELVVADGLVTIYLTDANAKAIDAKGASASAVVLANKKQEMVPLAHVKANMMQGKGGFLAAKDLRVVVSIALPGKSPAQIRFADIVK
ncbi:MAG: hypothetical protein ACT4P2_11060 [Pseudomonadota bacterium]